MASRRLHSVRRLQTLTACGQGFVFKRPLPAESLDHVLLEPHFLVPERPAADAARPS